MIQLELNLHSTVFDKQYGRIDFAPRVMGQDEHDGEFGYLLAYVPTSGKYLVKWDDGGSAYLSKTGFVIISNVTFTK